MNATLKTSSRVNVIDLFLDKKCSLTWAATWSAGLPRTEYVATMAALAAQIADLNDYLEVAIPYYDDQYWPCVIERKNLIALWAEITKYHKP